MEDIDLEYLDNESLYRNRFRILRKLGEGGSSVVYMAVDQRTDKPVTIKIIKEHVFDGKDTEQIVMEETKVLRFVKHPSIPRVVAEYDDAFVLEYVPGNSLSKVLKSKGRFEEKEVVDFGFELLDMLGYLHSLKWPVIYRDLKPANIMLRPDGHLSLIDFGAARFMEPGGITDTLNLGTEGFAAPEQYGNLGQTDPRTDIYCFGKTLLLLLGGKCSPELMEVIDKCIRPDREDRYESCQEIAKELKNYPKRRIQKRVFKVAQLFVASLAGSAVISFAAAHMDAAMSYAASDALLRVPAVKERMGNAGLRIKEILKENYGVDVDEILAPEGEMDR
ncbi:MAG: serine/threonine protein kinase [Butyrivibrio sp.]|nr:serine/threonine protein kinase [Butyrivibrio sp.]